MPTVRLMRADGVTVMLKAPDARHRAVSACSSGLNETSATACRPLMPSSAAG